MALGGDVGESTPGDPVGCQPRDVGAVERDPCRVVPLSMPTIALNNVDLPAPFDPITVIASPLPTSRLMSCTMFSPAYPAESPSTRGSVR